MKKVLIIDNFHEDEEARKEFRRQIAADVTDAEVIYIPTTENKEELAKEIAKYQGQFDRVYIDAHGAPHKDVGLLVHLTKADKYVPMYEVIAMLNKDNSATLKEFHFSSCYGGNKAKRHFAAYTEEMMQDEDKKEAYEESVKKDGKYFVNQEEISSWIVNYSGNLKLAPGQMLYRHSNEEPSAVHDYEKSRLKTILTQKFPTDIPSLILQSPESLFVKREMVPIGEKWLDVTTPQGEKIKLNIGDYGTQQSDFHFDITVAESNLEPLQYKKEIRKAVKRAETFQERNGLRPQVTAANRDFNDAFFKEYFSKRFYIETLKQKYHMGDCDAFIKTWKKFADKKQIDIDYSLYQQTTPLALVLDTTMITPKVERVANFMLDHNANGNSTSFDQFTPLGFAARGGSANIIRRLLKNPNVDPNQYVQKQTPLMIAAFNNQPAAVSALLDDSRVDLTLSEKEIGNKAIHIAANKGYVEVAEILLVKDPSLIEQKGFLQRLPLQVAVMNGHRDMVKFLLKRDAKALHHYDDERHTPLTSAVFRNDPGVVRLLLEDEAAMSHFSIEIAGKAIHIAAEKGYVEVAGILLAKDPSIIEQKGFLHRLPLHAAATNGHHEMAELLLKHDKKALHHYDDEQYTPLMHAVYRNNPKMVSLLLENGATIPQFSIDMARKNNYDEILKIFQEHKGKIAEKTPSNPQELKDAALSSNLEEFTKLCAKEGFNPNAKVNGIGFFEIVLEAQIPTEKKLGMVQALLKHPDVDPNILFSNNYPPLSRAIFKDLDEKIVMEFVKHPRTNLNHEVSPGWSALRWTSVKPTYQNVLEALVTDYSERVNPNLLDASGYNTLNSALHSGDTKTAKILLQHPKIDVNMVSGGFSSLMFSTWKGDYNIARQLLEKGADADFTNNGNNALTVADKTPGINLKLTNLLKLHKEKQSAKPTTQASKPTRSSHHTTLSTDFDEIDSLQNMPNPFGLQAVDYSVPPLPYDPVSTLNNQNHLPSSQPTFQPTTPDSTTNVTAAAVLAAKLGKFIAGKLR